MADSIISHAPADGLKTAGPGLLSTILDRDWDRGIEQGGRYVLDFKNFPESTSITGLEAEIGDVRPPGGELGWVGFGLETEN